MKEKAIGFRPPYVAGGDPNMTADGDGYARGKGMDEGRVGLLTSAPQIDYYFCHTIKSNN